MRIFKHAKCTHYAYERKIKKIILFNSVSVPQEKATGSHCEVHKSRLSEALCALNNNGLFDLTDSRTKPDSDGHVGVLVTF